MDLSMNNISSFYILNHSQCSRAYRSRICCFANNFLTVVAHANFSNRTGTSLNFYYSCIQNLMLYVPPRFRHWTFRVLSERHDYYTTEPAGIPK